MLARIVDNTIVEIYTGFGNFAVEHCFHPALLAQCIPVPEGAGIGWTQQEDGSWVAPTPVTPTDTGSTT